MADCKHGQPEWAACPKCIDESVDAAYERIAALEAALTSICDAAEILWTSGFDEPIEKAVTEAQALLPGRSK